MSRHPPGWPSWNQGGFLSPGAGPSGSRFNNTEQELSENSANVRVARSRGGIHVPPYEAGYTQHYNARVRSSAGVTGPLFPAPPPQCGPVPGPISPPFPCPPLPPFPCPPLPVVPVPTPAALPAWASTSTPVPLAPYYWPPAFPTDAPAPMSMPTQMLSWTPNPAPVRLPPPAPPVTYSALTTYAPYVTRSLPTGARRETITKSQGAADHFAGPFVNTPCFNSPREAVAARPSTRKRTWDMEEGEQQPKRARLEWVVGVAAAMGRKVHDGSSGEGGKEEGKGREGGRGDRGDGSERTWPRETRTRRIAPKPAPWPVVVAGGLRLMPVVLPQAYDNALQSHNIRSTTSTYRVDNPTGEFVIEPVMLASGGPSMWMPAGSQGENSGPYEYDHDGHQHQLGDESSLSKREAAVVIDEKIYGRDPLRCLACNNMSFARKYDRRRHVVTIHYLNKVPCDWCGMFFYARRDGVTRHKDENCPARDFEDRHTNPMRWFMAWLSGPSGWR